MSTASTVGSSISCLFMGKTIHQTLETLSKLQKYQSITINIFPNCPQSNGNISNAVQVSRVRSNSMAVSYLELGLLLLDWFFQVHVLLLQVIMIPLSPINLDLLKSTRSNHFYTRLITLTRLSVQVGHSCRSNPSLPSVPNKKNAVCITIRIALTYHHFGHFWDTVTYYNIRIFSIHHW